MSTRSFFGLAFAVAAIAAALLVLSSDPCVDLSGPGSFGLFMVVTGGTVLVAAALIVGAVVFKMLKHPTAAAALMAVLLGLIIGLVLGGGVATLREDLTTDEACEATVATVLAVTRS